MQTTTNPQTEALLERVNTRFNESPAVRALLFARESRIAAQRGTRQHGAYEVALDAEGVRFFHEASIIALAHANAHRIELLRLYVVRRIHETCMPLILVVGVRGLAIHV
jgi:hypothetical protein